MFKLDGKSEGLVINKEVELNLRDDLAIIMASAIKDRIVNQILATLSPKNFMGEALDYLNDHSLEQTEVMKLQYATLMLEDFKKNINSLIYVDANHKIIINQSIADFEYGTYFKPAIKILTKSLEISSETQQKVSRSSQEQ